MDLDVMPLGQRRFKAYRNLGFLMDSVAYRIAVVGGDATAHDVHQNYKAKGSNTYQIFWPGNPGIAFDGARGS
jgi:hypothetical protein